MKKQINIQMSLNPCNVSHMELLTWMNEQTKNRSSFIRETMILRMTGELFQYQNRFVQINHNEKKFEIDREEVLDLISI